MKNIKKAKKIKPGNKPEKQRPKKNAYISTNFSKASSQQKRIMIAQDAIKRILAGQFIPATDWFVIFDTKNIQNQSVKEMVEKKEKCQVCAKGALFLSFIKNRNNYKTDRILEAGNCVELDSIEMMMLSRIFSTKQLTLIETAYEGEHYCWNDRLTEDEEDACIRYYSKYRTSRDRLLSICKNIIKNNGEFKP